jgi:hypothetical protein
MSVSLIYGQGNLFSTSINEGSMYVEVSYTKPLTFDNTLTITEPFGEAIDHPTVSNYPQIPHNFFMGSFDGFSVHKIYREGNLVMTVQGVNQDMFIPVSYDRIESVCMDLVPEELTDDPQYHPHVPAPGMGLLVAMASVVALSRRR